jgi:hypothetical protein
MYQYAHIRLEKQRGNKSPFPLGERIEVRGLGREGEVPVISILTKLILQLEGILSFQWVMQRRASRGYD